MSSYLVKGKSDASGVTLPGVTLPGTVSSCVTAPGVIGPGLAVSATPLSGAASPGVTASGTPRSGAASSGVAASGTPRSGAASPGVTASGTPRSGAASSGATIPVSESSKTGRQHDRREFLRRGAVATAALTILPRHLLGGRGYPAPSDHLTKGIIGVGGMGLGHFNYENTRLLAVCDVDANHLKRALDIAGAGVKGYHDFRELLARPDIDIVHIATPPHWHGVIAKMAAEAGKDIWCEKPMTRTIGEGKRLMEAVKANGRMFRLNTWFRFKDPFYGLGTTVRPLKKVVDSGVLGWPLKVTISGVTGYDWKFYWSGRTDLLPEAVPPELDYEMWLGPAPYKPYNRLRVHDNFRGYWDYDGGGLGDMGQHYLDPVQYLLGKDDTSPVTVEIDAPQQHYDAAGSWRRITYTYADGCCIILDGENRDKDAAYIEGPHGKIYRGFVSDIPDLQKLITTLPDPEPQVTLFTESVKTRKPFALNEENGHRSCTLVNMGVVALRLGRNLQYDPVNQLFIDDEAANRLSNPPMRGGWHI